jgi:hypothetical protein
MSYNKFFLTMSFDLEKEKTVQFSPCVLYSTNCGPCYRWPTGRRSLVSWPGRWRSCRHRLITLKEVKLCSRHNLVESSASQVLTYHHPPRPSPPRSFRQQKVSAVTQSVMFHYRSLSCYYELILIKRLSTMPWRCMGEWRYISIFLDLSTKWRWVVSLSPHLAA